jgi:hypothetical protein
MNMVAAIARTTYMRILIQLPVGNYLKEVIGRLILVTVCSVPLPYVIYTQVGNGWWQLFAVTVVFLVIYSVSIYVVGLSLFERDLIKKVFNQKFKISGR